MSKGKTIKDYIQKSKEDKIIKLLEVQKEMINNCMAYCELNNKIIKEIRKGLK